MKIIYQAPELKEFCTRRSGVLCASTGEQFSNQTKQDDDFYDNWE